MAYIGLDLGSTYTKIALLSQEHGIKEKRIATPARLDHGCDRYEIDGDAYFDQIFSLLEEFARDGAQGILLSTQMHGWILTDECFHPLTPYVSWQDRIGAKHLEDLGRIITPDQVAPSGVPLKANLALSSLWGRMQEGFVLRSGVRLCTLGGYLVGRLTGQHTCHMTNAAPTGLADVQNGGWNWSLLERLGLQSLILPNISLDLKPVGYWRKIPVYPDLGDQQVCAAGADLRLDSSLHVSVGTAGLIGVLTQEWGCGQYENRPWITSGCYLRTVSGLPGGRNVAALKDEIAAKIPAAIPEDDVWLMMTTLEASHLPIEAHNELERVKAFYISMAQNYRKAADRMHRDIKHLSFSGGCAAKNPELRSELAKAFSTSAFSPQDHDVMLGFQSVIEELED